MIFRMFAWYGAAGKLYSMWLCKLHTIENHVLCHATVGVSSTNLLKAEESRCLYVLQLYSIGESVQSQHITKDCCYG